MILISELVWDDWNRNHLAKHGVTVQEVEEVCHGQYRAWITYRKRIIVKGPTRTGKTLTIVLSAEDRNQQKYNQGVYYTITAYTEGI